MEKKDVRLEELGYMGWREGKGEEAHEIDGCSVFPEESTRCGLWHFWAGEAEAESEEKRGI